MNAILIESNPIISDYFSEISSFSIIDSNICYQSDSPREVAIKISNLEKDNEVHILIINIELILNNSYRQNFLGGELLFWLRLNNRSLLPILLYGFHGCGQILSQHPEYFIIHAPGNYYLRLPIDWRDINFNLLVKRNPLTPEKINKQYLKFLKTSFNIEKFRHREANWWGVKCIHDVHRIVICEAHERFPYHETLASKLEELNNLIARTLFEPEEKEIGKFIQKEYKKIKSLRKKLQQRKPKILYIDDKFDFGWSDIFTQIIYGQDITRVDNEYFAGYLADNIPLFYCLKDAELYDGGHLASKVTPLFQGVFKDIDLILLDLRLHDEEEKGIQVECLSGYQFLKFFRKNFKGIPVVITTASNKVWSYARLLKLGADGYWIKEGIDEQRDPESTVKNYIRFIEMISHCSGREYGILKHLSQRIKELTGNGQYWWMKEMHWKNGDFSPPVDKGIVLFELRKVEEIFSSYLRNSFISSEEEGASIWLSSIIIQLNYIIERIHGTFNSKIVGGGNTGDRRGGWRFERNREDWVGCFIMRTRNNAAHPNLGDKLFDFDIVSIVIQVVLKYLESQNYCQLKCPSNDLYHDYRNWVSSKRAWEELIKLNGITLDI